MVGEENGSVAPPLPPHWMLEGKKGGQLLLFKQQVVVYSSSSNILAIINIIICSHK